MHSQLESVIFDYVSARERLRALAAEVEHAEWANRPAPGRWSVAECVAHLNLTAEAYLPLIDEALARARAVGRPAPKRYRRTVVGWLLARTMGPPVRMRTRTLPRFVPGSAAPKDVLLAEFERLHEAQVERVRASDGLPIDQVRMVSPFNARITYDLYSCFTILSRHEHRHLWQAEQAVATLEEAGGTGRDGPTPTRARS